MYLGTGEETPINYVLPLSDPADEAPNDETNENIIQNERPAVNHGPIEEMEVDENDKFGKKYSTTEPPTKLVMKPDL